MTFTPLNTLTVGQTFVFQNVTNIKQNYCQLIEIGKTPTGRATYIYKFNGKICKNSGKDLVQVVQK